MQRPTLTNVHIRSAPDAHKLFYAVQLGLLPKIEKRLDANERTALQPGDVYVWEERGPNMDSFSVSMERFTEGKSWTASRVREDFLMYFESPRKGKGNARTSENQVVRPGEQDLYIKLTYSVIREDVSKDGSQSNNSDDKHKKPPKWHMNAYFTKLTEGQLRTIDDIPMLRDLEVPDGIFRSARTTKPGKRGEGSRNASSTVKRMYAPFPPHPPRRVRESPPPPPLPVLPGPSSVGSMSMPLSVPDAFAPPPPLLPPSGPVPLHALPPVSFKYSESIPQSSLATALSHPDMNLIEEMKPPLTPITATPYTPTIVSAVTQPTPHYAWTSESPISIMAPYQEVRLSNSHSPASSERSIHSLRSVHMSPSLSSSSTSSQDSPMLMAATPPLWDDGEPYKPAPILPMNTAQEPRVDLAPLETLPRSHAYRRCPADDRALRLLALGPGAR
ncbi:Gti1/Pac2 family-domain-containing protein [Ganoderma leucocontextum]|nr:Gti1/Pac2 family-domain-containing protein [Ganoderma leucocontextum]